MTNRHFRAITTGLLTCGLAALAPTTGGAQDQSNTLPLEKTNPMTLTGCFVRGETAGHKNTYVLANPIVGSVTSVPDGSCTPSGQLVKLERINRRVLDNINTGTMVEVTGRLERAYSSYFKNQEGCERPNRRLRELEVADAHEVPVVAPRVAVMITPAPTPAPEAAAPQPEAPPAVTYEAPAPVGTTGVIIQEKKHHHKRLPHTASQVPLVGLIGLLALAGGFVVRRIPSLRAV